MSVTGNHYETLKLRPDASAEQIQAAYRNLCRIHHPDLSTKDPGAAHEIMAKINAAYEILSRPDRRAEYDGELAQEKAAAQPVTEAEPEPSRYFIPPEDDEEARGPEGKPFQRRTTYYEADHREATQAFLAHFLKRVLLIVVVAGLAIYLVVAAGAEDKDSGGWLIIRALRRVFTSW